MGSNTHHATLVGLPCIVAVNVPKALQKDKLSSELAGLCFSVIRSQRASKAEEAGDDDSQAVASVDNASGGGGAAGAISYARGALLAGLPLLKDRSAPGPERRWVRMPTTGGGEGEDALDIDKSQLGDRALRAKVGSAQFMTFGEEHVGADVVSWEEAMAG